tara:strand:- start:6122 stop:6358 length:237 start_codon:yes stop_codon:yes gene_type:complete
MPQIGWFEILIIVVLAILIIGPKDFPIVLKKIGGWVGSVKNYFSEIQKDVVDIETSVKKEVSLEDNYLNKIKDKNRDE